VIGKSFKVRSLVISHWKQGDSREWRHPGTYENKKSQITPPGNPQTKKLVAWLQIP